MLKKKEKYQSRFLFKGIVDLWSYINEFGELKLRLIGVSPPYRGESLKFRLLFRIFGKFCEKKADSIGFRAYASSRS